jgi:hypothetical protein
MYLYIYRCSHRVLRNTKKQNTEFVDSKHMWTSLSEKIFICLIQVCDVYKAYEYMYMEKLSHVYVHKK